MYNRVKRAIDSTWTSSIAGKCTPVPHSHSVLYLPVYSVTFSYVFFFFISRLDFSRSEEEEKKEFARRAAAFAGSLAGSFKLPITHPSRSLHPFACPS